jgi:mannosyltransferase
MRLMSERRLWLAFFILAFVLGAYLRLSHLGLPAMSADEGATWASASAPSASEVVSRQQDLNPGKLPAHDLLLHAWIGAFGDGLAAMRLISAIAGLAAVLLIVPVTREVLRVDGDEADGAAIRIVAGLALAICALSLVSIKYSREMRMYSLLIAAAELQAWVLLRALRRGGWTDSVAVAVCTALVVAINTVAAPMLAAEAAWLLFVFACNPSSLRGRAARVLLALIAGVAALIPALAVAGMRAGQRAGAGSFAWLEAPPLWAPISLFSKAEGTFAFPLAAILAAWGVWRTWGRRRLGISFVITWMLLPPILLVVGSYAYRPMFLERYLVYVFVPLFILCAIGIWALTIEWRRVAATILVIALSLGHVWAYSRKMHGIDWAQATAIALRAANGAAIAVAPSYATSVVRYYVAPARRDSMVTDGGDSAAAVLIVAPSLIHNPATLAELHRKYPTVVEQHRGVGVRSRDAQTPAQ